MTKLCKHDWVGDDNCAYCLAEDVNDKVADLERQLAEAREQLAECQQDYKDCLSGDHAWPVGYEEALRAEGKRQGLERAAHLVEHGAWVNDDGSPAKLDNVAAAIRQEAES